AFRYYRDLERILKEELDAAPSAAARALVEPLTAGGTPPAAPAARPSPGPGASGPLPNTPPSALTPAARLPTQFTRFFGREEEIAPLRPLLLPRAERLVTLTGPGGSGKTRLALAVAERVAEAWAGAVWFVRLADLADPQRIVEAVHTTL